MERETLWQLLKVKVSIQSYKGTFFLWNAYNQRVLIHGTLQVSPYCSRKGFLKSRSAAILKSLMKYEVNNPISMQSNCFLGDNAISGFQFRQILGAKRTSVFECFRLRSAKSVSCVYENDKTACEYYSNAAASCSTDASRRMESGLLISSAREDCITMPTASLGFIPYLDTR